MKKLFITLGIVIILVGTTTYLIDAFNTTAVILSNQSSGDLTSLKIETRNNCISVVDFKRGPIIKPGDSRVVRMVHSIGESSVKVTFNDGRSWEGCYIEDGYKVKVVFDEVGIRCESLSLQKFILGMW